MIRYSLLLTDTVKVGHEVSTILTDGCTKLKEVVMELEVSNLLWCASASLKFVG
jgi:hypothetical protein